MFFQGPLTNKGYFLVERGWMDFSLFKRTPYSEREAWIYLLENAAFQPIVREVDGMAIELGRGELVASYRYLAEAWGWQTKSGPAKDRCRRFLLKLERHNWVCLSTDYAAKRDSSRTGSKVSYDKRPTIIAINDYNSLQRRSLGAWDTDKDSTLLNCATALQQDEDKPNQFQSMERKELSKESVRRSSESMHLFERFPDVQDSDDFINHMPDDWKEYVLEIKGQDEYWLENEAQNFWIRYAGGSRYDRQYSGKSFETRSYWNKVWVKWCDQEFRTYYTS